MLAKRGGWGKESYDRRRSECWKISASSLTVKISILLFILLVMSFYGEVKH